MVFRRNPCYLVGQLSASLHLLQSVLVARALGFRRRAFFVVLARNARHALTGSVDFAGRAGGIDAQRLLPQSHALRRSAVRSSA